jgi:hypothetical protein
MLVFHDQMAVGKTNKSFGKVVNFKCLGKILKKQHFMHEEIRSRLYPENS